MARFLFGPYEFDSGTLELLRNGASVRLQTQPAHVLEALIESPGQIVSREQLRQTVWGEATFVDFENGLNFCVSQLRAALRDDAAQPVYIRTVPRRGYQFVAPMRVLDGAEPERPIGGVPSHGRSRSLVRTAIPWGAAAIIAAAGVVLLLRHSHSVHTAPPIVGVVRFDNETGAPAFDAFANNLTDELIGQMTDREGKHYTVAGNARVLFLPREQRDLRNIASSLNASYIVLGQVQASGDRIRVLAHLIRASDQTHLWVVREERPASEMPKLDGQLAEEIAAVFADRLASNPDRAGSFQAGSH